MQIGPICVMDGVKGDVRLSEGQNHPPIPISPGDSTSQSVAQDCYSQPASNTPQDVPDFVSTQVNAPSEVMDTSLDSFNISPVSPSEIELSGISNLYIDEKDYDFEYYDNIDDTPVTTKNVPNVDLTVQIVSVPDDNTKVNRDGDVICVHDGVNVVIDNPPIDGPPTSEDFVKLGVNTDDTFNMIQIILNEVIDFLPIEINALPNTKDFVNQSVNFDDNIPDCQSLKGHLLDHNKYP